MSRETLTWLNQNTLVGFTSKRGNAWHYKASEQGSEPNHYEGAVPVADVERRLFHWDAVTAPITATVLTADGVTTVTDDERQAIVRPDTAKILGVFKSGYKIHQYREWLLNNVATILDDDLAIGSAGLLKGGAVAWVSVEVPENIVTPEGVEFRPNLLATTSHDGSLATTYKRVVTNVVCDNTHGLALSEKGQQAKLKHSAKSLGRINDLRAALSIVHTIKDEFEAEVAELCRIEVNRKAWSSFLDLAVPLFDEKGQRKTGRALTVAEHKRAKVRGLYEYDDRVAPWTGTAWGVVQAINTYEHHEGIVRGGERVERNQLRALTSIDQLDAGTLSLLNKALALAS